MLLRRERDHLALEQAQGGHDLAAGVRRRDDRIDITALCCDVRVHESVLVLVLQLEAQCLDVCTVRSGILELAAVHEPDGTRCAHDCDLRGRPREVDVGAMCFEPITSYARRRPCG